MFVRIPISTPGCSSKNKIKLGSKSIDGVNNDLSMLSVERGSWSKVRVTNVSNHLSIFLNDTMVFEHDLTDDYGKLAGVRIAFERGGEVRNFVLASKGKDVLSLK